MIRVHKNVSLFILQLVGHPTVVGYMNGEMPSRSYSSCHALLIART